MGRNNRTKLDDAELEARQAAPKVELIAQAATPQDEKVFETRCRQDLNFAGVLEATATGLRRLAIEPELRGVCNELLGKIGEDSVAEEEIKDLAATMRDEGLAYLRRGAGTGQEACPTLTVSADTPFGMKVMVALAHWAAAAHDVDAETRRAFREKVREFELWREGNR